MEIDGDLEVIGIAVVAGALLDGSDLGIEAIGNGIGSDGIGDAMRAVGQSLARHHPRCNSSNHSESEIQRQSAQELLATPF